MERRPQCGLTATKIKYLSGSDAHAGIRRMNEMAETHSNMDRAEFVAYECTEPGGCGYWHVASKKTSKRRNTR